MKRSSIFFTLSILTASVSFLTVADVKGQCGGGQTYYEESDYNDYQDIPSGNVYINGRPVVTDSCSCSCSGASAAGYKNRNGYYVEIVDPGSSQVKSYVISGNKVVSRGVRIDARRGPVVITSKGASTGSCGSGYQGTSVNHYTTYDTVYETVPSDNTYYYEDNSVQEYRGRRTKPTYSNVTHRTTDISTSGRSNVTSRDGNTYQTSTPSRYSVSTRSTTVNRSYSPSRSFGGFGGSRSSGGSSRSIGR